MNTKLNIWDFSFTVAGYGHYYVTYTDKKNRTYGKTINDMTLIDNTKNSDEPKQVDLKELLRNIKSI